MICLFCNLSDVFIFVRLNHFYCENNKGPLYFRCNENDVIVVVAINRQYLHTVYFSAVAYVIPWFFFVNQGCYIPKCSS